MERIAELRRERGWSQVKLGAKAEVNPSTVNQIERGMRHPNSTTLEKLAGALEVGVADLFDRADTPKAQAPNTPGQPDSASLRRAAQEAKHELYDVSDKAGALPAYWNTELERYTGQDLPPYRSFEMLCAADRLYEDFFKAFEAIKRDAAAEGYPNPAAWDSETKTMLLGTGAKLRALGELASRIHEQRSVEGSSTTFSREDARAVRKEFDASPPEGLPNGPEWSSVLDEARAAAGVA